MSYLSQMTLTVSEARQMEHDGYILHHVMMHLDGTDTYEVSEKGK